MPNFSLMASIVDRYSPYRCRGESLDVRSTAPTTAVRRDTTLLRCMPTVRSLVTLACSVYVGCPNCTYCTWQKEQAIHLVFASLSLRILAGTQKEGHRKAQKTGRVGLLCALPGAPLHLHALLRRTRTGRISLSSGFPDGNVTWDQICPI